MILSELLENEALRQFEFPVAQHKIFLAHAGVCPLPRRVAEAIRAYASLSTQGDQETLLPPFQLHQTRALAAQLLNAQPDEIAFVGPTSLALSSVAGGVRLKRNDNIIIYLDDYPSNVYPWLALAKKGVQVRLLQPRDLGRIRPVDVLSQIDEQTRLVALASAHFISGFRIDLDELGKILRQKNILFCVDAIQTLGAFPTPIEHVDFLAADAHKWLLGPCAAGVFLVRRHAPLDPIFFGWNNVQCQNYVARPEILLKEGARRFEPGSHNLLGLVGLHAALELILELGIAPISTELLRKRAWLVPALKTKGYTVLQAEAAPQHTSAIISFFHPHSPMTDLHHKLEQANIMTSLRTDRSGQQYIRISPHFYNTDAELHRFLEFL